VTLAMRDDRRISIETRESHGRDEQDDPVKAMCTERPLPALPGLPFSVIHPFSRILIR
jgi:hypothetical protein